MRLPYPTRININHVMIAAVLLLFAQLLDGTDPVFAFLACLTMVFSAMAFNVLGGLATTSGAMRLPYPTRININHVLIVAVLLLFAQLLDGTDPVFAFLACLAMVFSAMAFNLLDGLATTSGAFVFFLAIPTFLILLFLKVFTLGTHEPSF